MCPHDEATRHTRAAHRRALEDPIFDWADRQDFEFASHGLIHRPADPDIRNAAGEVVWHHEAFEAFLSGDAPETVHPSLWRHALLNNFRGLFKVTDGVYQVRGESLANVTFLETDHGYVVIDPLNTTEVAAYALGLLYEHVGERPIVAVVYSHTHSDHFGGIKGIVSEDDVSAGKVRILASEGFLEWVLKEQGLAAEGMASRNAYMYGEVLPIGPRGLVDTGLGQMIEGGEIGLIEPTDIIGPEGGRLTIDGLRLDFMYAPGEAPTGMHVYCDRYRTLHVADNCYMCLHNVYTIRGAFPRDAMQWADSVARSLEFDETEFLVSGHNWPVLGRANARRFMEQQRDAIRYMHDQTLRLMSHGFVPEEIANLIEFPPALARLWHLRGYYGSLVHNVRGIYAYYLGWYDGNPAHLDALPPREAARRTIDYMGGVAAVIARAEQDFAAGDYRWVVQVLDHVLWLEPGHTAARELAAAAHVQLGYGAENATWRNAYLTAAQELRDGLPGATETARVIRDVVKGMPAVLLLNALSVRLNGPRAVGGVGTVNWALTDTGERCHTELTNSVLINGEGHDADANVTVHLTRDSLGALALGEIGADELGLGDLGLGEPGPGESVSGAAATRADIRVAGDPGRLVALLALLDPTPVWFPVASHDRKPGER